MKFYLEISYDLFFWTTIRGDRRGQSRKSGDFDQNTRNGLKSSLLSFINRETVKFSDVYVQNLYDFQIKFFLWFAPIRHQHTLCPFRSGHLGIFVRMAAIGNLPYGVFLFTYDICMF